MVIYARSPGYTILDDVDNVRKVAAVGLARLRVEARELERWDLADRIRAMIHGLECAVRDGENPIVRTIQQPGWETRL